MKVSVIIPAYNEGTYITQTLAAVKAQDFQDDFEILVVDNASTDDTGSRAAAFPGVRVVREEKKGVQHARERGRREARGEILVYLDADTLPPLGWLKNGTTYFKRPDIVGVSGPLDYYDARPLFRRTSLVFQKIGYRGMHFLVHRVWRKGAVMVGGNSFIRASAMERINGFNTAIVFYGDDTDTGRRLGSVGRVLYRNDIVVRSSARRFVRMGIMRVLALYLLNFFWVTVFHKPFFQKS
ncbi:MAG: glycosyltransferase family 2 protein [bacterium]|nr:glycosyltransferase family 2 protein [bacterium]